MDDSLDDFFAKKDKSNKKKKGKSKPKLASELLPAVSTTPPPQESKETVEKNVSDRLNDVKISEETTIPDSSGLKEKKKSKKKRDGGDAGGGPRDDDEWNDVPDEVDYSGLRIATKNIAKEAEVEAAENAARSEPEYDEDGQIIEKSTDNAVWKLPVTCQTAEVVEEAPKAAPPPVIAEMPNVSGGKYVPPSRRGGASSSSDLEPLSMKRAAARGRNKQAPNVNSQEDFPTLGSAPPPVDYDVSKFERVRGGGNVQAAPVHGDSQRLETSNMYSALDRQ